jgi:alpha/beta superfamily hydrolase
MRSAAMMSPADSSSIASWTTPDGLREQAGYLPQSGEDLYYVQHFPAGSPLGLVLLAGPFATDRSHVYVSWVRWARFLARSGFSVLRFDYRGQGESTGPFEEFGFSEWLEDLAACASWLKHDQENCRLALCGLRLGGLLASCAFAQGIGDALLMWSPPASGRAMLTETLRRRVAADLTAPESSPRKTRDQYIADMESGGFVEVEGYCWSQRLWEQAADYVLRHERAGGSPPEDTCRPWRSLVLEPCLGLIAGNLSRIMDPVRRIYISPLNMDLEPFFASNVEWLRSALDGREKT